MIGILDSLSWIIDSKDVKDIGFHKISLISEAELPNMGRYFISKLPRIFLALKLHKATSFLHPALDHWSF